MHVASISKNIVWKRNGNPLHVSRFSLPCAYDPETDKLVETDDWGWHDHNNNTWHCDPKRPYVKDKYPMTDSENRRVQLAETLVNLGFEIIGD